MPLKLLNLGVRTAVGGILGAVSKAAEDQEARAAPLASPVTKFFQPATSTTSTRANTSSTPPPPIPSVVANLPFKAAKSTPSTPPTPAARVLETVREAASNGTLPIKPPILAPNLALAKPKIPPIAQPVQVSPSPPPQAPITLRVNVFDEIEKSNLSSVKKRVSPSFERAARNFIADEPEILMLTEYKVEDSFYGILVVWEKYRNASHYEVFKKNLFRSEADFERILYLDEVSLREETANFFPYLRDTLGLSELREEDVFIMLDHKIKQDRIYEYQVRASLVPRSVEEIDYDMILESQGLLNEITIAEDSNVTLFGFAGQHLGSEDLAWMLALVNDTELVRYFGLSSATQSLIKLLSRGPRNSSDGQDYVIFTPKYMNDVLTIIEDSISLFDVKSTFEKIVDVMGGLPREIKKAFLDSIDDSRNSFSFDVFKDGMLRAVPVFDLILSLAESNSEAATKELSKLSITIPANEGSVTLDSVENITKVFKHVNETSLAIFYSQSDETFEKLQEIFENINRERATQEEDALNAAVGEVRRDLTSPRVESAIPQRTANLFNINAGVANTQKDVRSRIQAIIGTSPARQEEETPPNSNNFFVKPGFFIK